MKRKQMRIYEVIISTTTNKFAENKASWNILKSLRFKMVNYLGMKTVKLITGFTILTLVFGCNHETRQEQTTGQYSQNEMSDGDDLNNERIERKQIVAITDYNSTNYFVYRGQLMGYQYELLQELADHLGKRLEVIVDNNLNEKFDKLVKGDVDLIAANLTITADKKKIADFTIPHGQTRQMLVQRKPENWEQMRDREIEYNLVRNQLDLAGKVIYVQEHSAYSERIKNLAEEIGDTIFIKMVNKEVEELIGMVAKGEIDYTVCDNNIAKLHESYYGNLDIQTPISFPQHFAWAVTKGNEELLNDINKWLKNFKTTTRYRVIYNKYFDNTFVLRYKESDFLAHRGGKVSVYDNQIKKYSEQLGWDWRLLASLIYQESRFKPHVKSWAGAFGLMQLMPQTAARFGVDSTSPPEENIRAGVLFLKWLDRQFTAKNISEEEKIKFMLAAYNAGYGHVEDAMKLAEKNGKDPFKWEDNVDYYILNKSNPKYYQDPVVQFGYCRGKEAYNYVYDIMSRYEHYKNIIQE